MITREEHQGLSLRIQMTRFWIENIADLDSIKDREDIILLHWEVLEIAKMLHPEVVLV